jgi:hypothetical protein
VSERREIGGMVVRGTTFLQGNIDSKFLDLNFRRECLLLTLIKLGLRKTKM